MWLMLAGLCGMHHEASVAHVVDPHTGELRHTSTLVGAHSGTHSDYHGARDRDADSGVCAISAVLHQAAAAPSAPLTAFAAPSAAPTELPDCAVVTIATTVYLLAPKTSPPARA